MSKKPKNLTFLPVVIEKAEEIRRKTGDPTFSALCVRLITEEHDRRVDREGWIVEIIATAIGKPAEEVRALIDARMPQAERELKREHRKGRAKGSTVPAP